MFFLQKVVVLYVIHWNHSSQVSHKKINQKLIKKAPVSEAVISALIPDHDLGQIEDLRK